MLKLIEVDFLEFKEKLYSYYVELFPEDERQPLNLLEKLYDDGIVKFIKICDDEINVGFLVYVTTIDNPYVWLSYFAIFKEYQNKKYGSRAIDLLKEHLKDFDGIYGEIEKIGEGVSSQENLIRSKRTKFWTSLGFEIIDIDLDLYEVIYSPCVFKIKNYEISDREVVNYGMMLYKATLGEELFNKTCFIRTK